jgi:hypothetical protein
MVVCDSKVWLLCSCRALRVEWKRAERRLRVCHQPFKEQNVAIDKVVGCVGIFTVSTGINMLWPVPRPRLHYHGGNSTYAPELALRLRKTLGDSRPTLLNNARADTLTFRAVVAIAAAKGEPGLAFIHLAISTPPKTTAKEVPSHVPELDLLTMVELDGFPC